MSRIFSSVIAALALIGVALLLAQAEPPEPIAASIPEPQLVAPPTEPPAVAATTARREAAAEPAPAPVVSAPLPPRLSPDPAAPRPQLRVRLVRDDRTPIASLEVAIDREESLAGRLVSIGSRARTDAQGFLDFDWTENLENSVRRVTIQAPAGSPDYSGCFDLSRTLEITNDLGEWMLLPFPVLATGIVLDPRGRGVPDATVLVVDRVGGLGSPIYWNEHQDTARRTAADGSFRLVGDPGTLQIPMTLVARKREVGESMRVEFQPGQHGIELRLISTATVSGSIVLPAGVPATLLTVQLLAEDESEASFVPAGRQRAVREDGHFSFVEVLPGSYRFVLYGHHPDPLLRVADVVVPSGGQIVDPRLQSIALASFAEPLRVECVDERGVAVDSSLMVRARGWDSSVGGHSIERGVFVVLSLAQGQDLLISAPGRQPQWIRDVRPRGGAPLRVVMLPMLRLRLTLAGDYPIAEAGRRLAVTLTPSAALAAAYPETLRNLVEVRGDFGTDRVVELFVAFPGDYSMTFQIHEGSGILAIDQAIDSLPFRVEERGPFERTLVAPEAVARAFER